jgi:hypothetical protein
MIEEPPKAVKDGRPVRRSFSALTSPGAEVYLPSRRLLKEGRMRSWKTLAAAALMTLVFVGTLLVASLPAGLGAPRQDEEAIAKALAERLHDSLGFDVGKIQPQEQAPVLYQLKVRGGPIPITISTIRRAEGGVVVYAHFKFKRGPKAAGADGKGLGPGECAWLLRRMNPDEPCELLFYGFDTKIHFKPEDGSRASGYEISLEVRSNRGGKAYPWHKDFFQSFSDPAFVTEFWVTKSKDSRYFVAGLD